MPKIEIADGIFHETPDHIKEALGGDVEILARWNKLTPIQRNEWICWITIPKKQETRDAHLQRMLEDLAKGKRQPCCWPGCPHRRPSAKKYFRGDVD